MAQRVGVGMVLAAAVLAAAGAAAAQEVKVNRPETPGVQANIVFPCYDLEFERFLDHPQNARLLEAIRKR